jgi:hypothetical protein
MIERVVGGVGKRTTACGLAEKGVVRADVGGGPERAEWAV